MAFTIRPFRRFPVHCPVTYSAGLFQPQGTVWNLSLTGWRLSGDLPIRAGETLSRSMILPNKQRIKVSEAMVSWSRGNEFAVETNQIDRPAKARLQRYIRRLILEPLKQSITECSDRLVPKVVS
jgi:PilZ domain